MASLEDRLVAAFQRVAGVAGAPIDWAARLQAGLVPAAGLLAATKALPGILRFATDTEAYVGLQDAAAVTPKQLLATHVADDFSVLHSMAAFLPAGSLVAVPDQSFAGNGSIPDGFIGTSLWVINPGQKASPIVPLVVNSLAYLNYAGFAPNQYSRLAFQPFRSMAWIQATGTPKVYDEYIWVGATTKWFIWRGTVTPTFNTPNVNYSSITTVTVNGLEASLALGVARSDSANLLSYSSLVILPTTARPPAERVFGGGASVPNAGWYLANWALQAGGDCLLLASNIPSNLAPNVAEGSITFKRVIPSV